MSSDLLPPDSSPVWSTGGHIGMFQRTVLRSLEPPVGALGGEGLLEGVLPPEEGASVPRREPVCREETLNP